MFQVLLANSLVPVQASKNAAEYDSLFFFILGVNILFSTLIMAMMIVFVLKYRHRKGRAHDPTAGHSTALELTWTIIPTMLVLGIFYFGFRGYLHANVMPPNAYEVTANGQMWNWSFTYPNGHTDPELHLVVNRPTRMNLQSSDVIHDLDIPAFRMKKDVVPGRINKEWFEPILVNPPAKPSVSIATGSTKVPPMKTADSAGTYGLYTQDGAAPLNSVDLEPGDTYGFELVNGVASAVYSHAGKTSTLPLDSTLSAEYTWKLPYEYYQVYCAMYCGQNHSVMLAKCVVQEQADYDKWLAYVSKWEDKVSYVDRGKDLYKQMGCAQCHSIDGSRLTGPTWKDLYGSQQPIKGGPAVLADDAYIVESILYPSKKIVDTYEDKMPQDFGSKLKSTDITALIWYMKSISANYHGDMAEGTKVGEAMKAGQKTAAPGSSAPGGPTTAPVFDPLNAPGNPPRRTPGT